MAFEMISPLKKYASDAQRKAVWASKADGGAGNPNKMLSPVKVKKVTFEKCGRVLISP